MSYLCQQCGKRFDDITDAELAAISGCPDCGATNITKTPICGCNTWEGRLRDG